MYAYVNPDLLWTNLTIIFYFSGTDLSNQYWYSCPNCDRAYSIKASLVRHMKYQCGKEPGLRCEKCLYVTWHISNLKRHCKARHGK